VQPRAHGERRGRRDRLASGCPDQLFDEPEVQIGLGRVGASRKYPQASGLGQATPRQGRFPYTRIALDGDQPRQPCRDPRNDLRYACELRRPADEKVKRRLPVLHASTSLPLAASATPDE
jgi:hypothetical protein